MNFDITTVLTVIVAIGAIFAFVIVAIMTIELFERHKKTKVKVMRRKSSSNGKRTHIAQSESTKTSLWNGRDYNKRRRIR